MSTWETQELPVLRALATHFTKPRARPASMRTIASATGLPEAAVRASIRVLAEAKPPYIEGRQLIHSDGPPRVTGLTERASHELDHLAVKADLEREPGGSGRIRRNVPVPPGSAPRSQRT
jgi:hypothetical protein